MVILGANGSGKILAAEGGGRPAAAGPAARVTLAGRELAGLPAHAIVEAGLALVPEGRGIFGELTVRENLLLGAFARRARAGEARNRERVLALFPRLAERLDQTARTMSGGEQQMVAIGRALMSAPDMLLLDEPSLGLSPLLCGELFRALGRIRGDGIAVLLVEQNARRSLAIADRGYLIENGRIVGTGTRSRPGQRSGGATRLSRRRKAGMMGILDGKICIVTGAAGSLGLASARRFAEEGARVMLVDRDRAGARRRPEVAPRGTRHRHAGRRLRRQGDGGLCRMPRWRAGARSTCCSAMPASAASSGR